MLSNRRQYNRFDVQCGCWLERADATIFGTTIDLGRGGLCLRGAAPLSPGAPVSVRLELGTGDQVAAKGTVAWVVRARNGKLQPGIGVRFTEFLQGETHLDTYLGALPA